MDKRIEIIEDIADILANRYGCASIIADILGEVCSLSDLERIKNTLENIQQK